MDFSRPLDNFPLVRTRKIAELRDTFARVYSVPSIELARGSRTIDAVLNECRFQHITLGFGSYGAAVHLNFPAAKYFLTLLPLRGKGEIVSGSTTLPMAAGASATISPDNGFRTAYDGDYEFLTLKIDPRALTRKLVAMTGATIDEPLRMNPQADLALPAAKILRDYVPRLAETLSGATPTPLPGWWIAQTEQLLMAMFLCGHRHNYSHLLEQVAPEAAPWQVRRVEEYIEANWRQPITLEDLAEVAGVSAFSLFRSFRKSRGYSPLEFAKRVRAAREGSQQ